MKNLKAYPVWDTVKSIDFLQSVALLSIISTLFFYAPICTALSFLGVLIHNTTYLLLYFNMNSTIRFIYKYNQKWPWTVWLLRETLSFTIILLCLFSTALSMILTFLPILASLSMLSAFILTTLFLAIGCLTIRNQDFVHLFSKRNIPLFIIEQWTNVSLRIIETVSYFYFFTVTLLLIDIISSNTALLLEAPALLFLMPCIAAPLLAFVLYKMDKHLFSGAFSKHYAASKIEFESLYSIIRQSINALFSEKPSYKYHPFNSKEEINAAFSRAFNTNPLIISLLASRTNPDYKRTSGLEQFYILSTQNFKLDTSDTSTTNTYILFSNLNNSLGPWLKFLHEQCKNTTFNDLNAIEQDVIIANSKGIYATLFVNAYIQNNEIDIYNCDAFCQGLIEAELIDLAYKTLPQKFGHDLINLPADKNALSSISLNENRYIYANDDPFFFFRTIFKKTQQFYYAGKKAEFLELLLDRLYSKFKNYPNITQGFQALCNQALSNELDCCDIIINLGIIELSLNYLYLFQHHTPVNPVNPMDIYSHSSLFQELRDAAPGQNEDYRDDNDYTLVVRTTR